MSYLIEHTVLFDGYFNWVTIASIVILLGTAIYCIVKKKKLKKKLKELQKAAEEKIET